MLILEFGLNVGMGHQILDLRPLFFVVLQTLTQERDGLKSQIIDSMLLEMVAALLHFSFELLSVPRMEWSETIKKFEKNTANRPNV